MSGWVELASGWRWVCQCGAMLRAEDLERDVQHECEYTPDPFRPTESKDLTAVK